MNYALGNNNQAFDGTDLSGANSSCGQNASLKQVNQLIQAAAFGTDAGAAVTNLATAPSSTAAQALLFATVKAA